MKRTIIILQVTVLIFILSACQDDNKQMNKNEGTSNENTLTKEELYDIKFLFKAPSVEEKRDFSNVIKLVLTENNSSEEKTIALDLDREIVYEDPSISSSGIFASRIYENVQNLEEIIDILEDYKVDSWKEDYTFESPESYEDGYGWSLWLQYEDGRVERHHGSGSFKDEIIPEQFRSFVDRLQKFIDKETEGLESSSYE